MKYLAVLFIISMLNCAHIPTQKELEKELEEYESVVCKFGTAYIVHSIGFTTPIIKNGKSFIQCVKGER